MTQTQFSLFPSFKISQIAETRLLLIFIDYKIDFKPSHKQRLFYTNRKIRSTITARLTSIDKELTFAGSAERLPNFNAKIGDMTEIGDAKHTRSIIFIDCSIGDRK